MNEKTIKRLGLGFTVLGAIVSIGAGIIGKKSTEMEIAKQVEKQIADKLGK